MDFRTTSTKRRQDALSLIEFIVAAGISTLVLSILAALGYFGARSFAAMTNYVDLDMRSRAALDQMSKDIRQCDSLASFNTNKLVFNYGGGNSLTYTYSASDRTLTRTFNNASKVLLTECDYLNFAIFQRNPVGGTYNQYPTADPATCKLVQLNWVCSRTILGSRANTESVQSAKIVIRRQ